MEYWNYLNNSPVHLNNRPPHLNNRPVHLNHFTRRIGLYLVRSLFRSHRTIISVFEVAVGLSAAKMLMAAGRDGGQPGAIEAAELVLAQGKLYS